MFCEHRGWRALDVYQASSGRIPNEILLCYILYSLIQYLINLATSKALGGEGNEFQGNIEVYHGRKRKCTLFSG